MSFENTHGAVNRRGTDPLIEMIAHKVSGMERSMDKLTEAITKLAVIEEKQTTDRQALERAFGDIRKTEERCAERHEKMIEKLSDMDDRVSTLEAAAPTSALTNGWVQAAMWAAASFGVYVVINKLGLI